MSVTFSGFGCLWLTAITVAAFALYGPGAAVLVILATLRIQRR